MTKRVVLFSMISALLLAGCGKSSPAEVARPVALGQAAAAPTAPAYDSQMPVYEEYPAAGTMPADGTVPAEWADEEEEATPEIAASTAEEIAAAEEAAREAAELKAKEEAEAAAKKAAEEAAEAAKKAAEEAERKAAEEAAAAKLKAPHTFTKSIGNGSLRSAQGLVLDGGKAYVLDNQRTGLLGKFAAVRAYDVASGDYLKLSIENIGWAGAKNMPATVSALKFENGQVLAADATTTYVFNLADAAFVEKREATFANQTEVKHPVNGDTYRLAGSKIERVHNGTVTVSFGEGQLTQGTAIAIDADGTLYVADAKGLVHVFTTPAQ